MQLTRLRCPQSTAEGGACKNQFVATFKGSHWLVQLQDMVRFGMRPRWSFGGGVPFA